MLYKLCLALSFLCLGSISLAGENELSPEEKKEGWQLLFDGKTTKGWMTIKEKPLAESYVQEGSLNPHRCEYMLVHDKVLENYVLALDFKVSPKCNSGIFIRTFPLVPRPGKDVGFNGMEVAVDDTKTAGFHDTGAIYDLVPAKVNAMKAAGEWNHAEITSNNNLLKVVINGEVTAEMDLDQWTQKNKRADGTDHKFDVVYKDHPRKGYIGLQDHGSDCWYRNIKLKVLPGTK